MDHTEQEATAERVEQPQPCHEMPRSQRQALGVAMLVWFVLVGVAARYGYRHPQYRDPCGTAVEYGFHAFFLIPVGVCLVGVAAFILLLPFLLIFS